MKYLIASDLHGSEYYAKKLLEAFEKENAQTLILLGDIYYHGPRNPLPEDYNPKGVAELLNGIADKLIVIKGNCDSQVDTLISEFDFIEDGVICVEDKNVFLTHGHVYNKQTPPKTTFAAVIYGHFHTGFIERAGNTVFANPGSLSLPKDGTPNSYMTLTGKLLELKTLSGETIANTEL